MTDSREQEQRDREQSRNGEPSVEAEPIRDLDLPEGDQAGIAGGAPPDPCKPGLR